MSYALDILVRQAQDGDDAARERLAAALRGPLLRHVRGLTRNHHDAEDVAQEALMDVMRGLGGYRWEASFLSWAYAIASRRAARQARAAAQRAIPMAEWLEESLALPQEPLAPAEQVLVEQDVNLACSFVVAARLSDGLRRAYLLGEVLGVTDAAGAEACGISRVAFRQRVSRARTLVNDEIRRALAHGASGLAGEQAADDLDRLLRLGELHRARGRGADGDAALRAAARAAPSLIQV